MSQAGALRVICLAGPTGAGKTDLAIAIGRLLGCEIINADSRQIYADFPIITAQPGPEEQAALPHHLYGFLETSRKISAGQWARMAAAEAGRIAARGRIPLLVGGSGFYFGAILGGLASIPDIPEDTRARVAADLERLGPEAMHSRLKALDPEYAGRIHPRDRQRIARALEVYEATGKNFTWHHRHGKSEALCSGPLLVFSATLAQLLPRLENRIRKMIAAGALEEAARAWTKYPDPAAPGWSGIGCCEVLAHLRGETGAEECLARWLKATRAYAKRQLTWFRGRPEAIWISGNMGEALSVLNEHGFQAHG